MINKINISVFITASTILLFSACRHHPDDLIENNSGNNGGDGGNSSAPCDPVKVYFQQQVQPVLISNCAMSGCHDEASHQGGVVLTSYEKVMTTADVRPGNPGNSDLYEVLIDTDPDKRMPRAPRSPLSQNQIRLIYNWIQQGAQNLVCQNLCDSSSFSYSASIKILVENKCQGCHNGPAPQGGIDLSSYPGLKAKADDGKLWGAINHFAGFSPMPKNGAKLSDCEITQVRKWIENGAPNN